MRIKISKNKHRVGSKQGFTLLETMLSIALLLVLVVIVYQGFVSTMQVSTDSALYSKSGAAAAGNVYSKMGSTVVSASITPVAAIHLQFSATEFKNLGVVVCTSAPTTNTAFGNSAFRESANLNSTYRHGFIYCGKSLS